MLRRIQRTVSSQGNREEASHEIQAPFENVSFMCITRENFVRKHLIKVVRSRWFERFVILIILANCVMLAMYDPLDAKCLKRRCQLLERLEKVVFFFFPAEMLAKMVAMGIHGPKGYFSDRWNILDFLIVVAGIVDISGPDGGDFLSIVRLSRVLRPLRAINRVPSIRILVTLLMDTIPMLGNVLLLKFLVFSIFGILGVQVWQGKLRNRCFPAPNASLPLAFNYTSKFYAPSSGDDYLCSLPNDRGMQSCSEIYDDCSIKGLASNTTCRIFGNYYTDCRQDGPNPYYDNMSFDNIAMAWIFIYQVVTSEGWSELMYLILDVSSKYSWIYFVVLITIGSFFVVNLSLVVITMQFSETKRREMQIIREQRRLHVTESQMSLISDFKIIWSKLFAPLAKCKRRKKSIHHFHHHEHFHITHHTIRCEKCNMFCGTTQPETVSSKEVSSDNGNSIPKVEISCFDDDIIQSLPLRRKLSVSCPSLFEIERTPERKFSGTSVRGIHRAKIEETQQRSLDKDARLNTEKKLEVLPQQKMYLTPRKENSTDPKTLTRKDSGTDNNALTPQKENTIEHKALTRKGSDVSNTLSIHAESVSSISIDKKQSPNHASLTTKTSLSLQVNGAGTQLKTEAYCEANACIAAKEGGKKKTAMFSAETKAANSVKLQTPIREKVCKTYSNGSYNSEVRSDDVSDIADTSSEALYGSMFDLRNADKYYVSVEPTFIQKFRMHCKNLSESRKFSHFIMLFIVLNTICMGLEHHNQPKKMTDILELLNLIFIWIFGFEVCVKLLGVGPKAYFKVGYNVFDCLIVVLSVAEILINDNKNSTIIVLRSLRLLRIFKLVRPMRHQMMVMIRTMSSVMTFFALLFLFMFTFAILGMHLFGGKFVFDGITSRSNFDSFSWAMATVFQILTQEDWNLVMYDGMRATETKWAALYFLALMTIGYYVLLNLLVAILVEGFTTPMEKRRMAKRIATMLLNKSNSRSYHSSTSGSSLPQPQRSISMPDIPDSPYISNQRNGITTFTESFLRARGRTMTKALSLRSISSIVASKKDYASGKLVAEKPKPGEPILVSARARMSRSGSLNEPYYALDANTQDMLITRPAVTPSVTTTSEVKVCPCFKEKADWSLFILSPENRFRKLLQVISANKWFDYFILLLIFYSCVLLAMENPNIQQGSTKQRVIQTSMFVLTWLFSAEMIIKVLAHGLLFGRDPYLRKGWNILDGLLVVLSWVDFALFLTQTGSQTDAIKAFRVLRALRSLRPLRMIRRAPGLKLVVQTLLYSLKPIGNTVLIAAIFFIVFGILGVQLMKGTFYHCEGGAATVIDRNQCNATNGIWVNYQYNFDDLPSALMALFVVSTKDGWVDIMRRGTDAVGIDKQPQENHSSWLLLYFISFLLIGGFLVLNMIVGVVVENFQRCRELQGDKDNAKKALAKWRECARTKLVHESFLKNYSGSRLILYKICTHSYWHIGITIVILLNVICMAMEHYNMSTTMSKFIYLSNIVFTILYVLEALLQIIALGFKQYFKNKWYLFDFIVVVVSVLGIALEEIITKDFKINPSVVRGVRMLRVVRVLKLLKVAKGLQFLLDHVKETIPQVTNLALLFSLLFFIYSCLGIQLFGTIECSAATPCAGLGKHANFKDLGSSMLTLFRIATGDNWSGILKDTLRSKCDDSSGCTRNCCLSRYASPLFFITFVLLAQFVLVNIVIAVLMKHLRVTKLCKGNLVSNKNSMRKTSKKESNPVEQSSEALSKWKLAAARRKARRDEKQELQANYVRTKRSTDGLDNIQLKQFRNRSEDEMEGNYNANNNNHIETDHVVIHREVQGSVNVSHESPDDGSKDKSTEGNRSRKSLWRRNPSFKINIDTSPDNETEKKEDIVKYRIAENLKKNYALVPFVSVAKTARPRFKEKGNNSDSFPRNDSDSFPRNDVEISGSKEEREQFIDDKNDCKIEIKDDADDDQAESEDIGLSFVSDHCRALDSRRTSSDYSSVSPRIDIEIQSDDDYDEKRANNCAEDLELEDKSTRTGARCLSHGSSIHENPVFESDSCRSLSGSPALHIPDDFFETSSDEDQSVPPRVPDCVQCESSPEIPNNIKEHGMKTGVIKDNLLQAAARELESADSCESFEILSEIHDGNNETPKDNGSNESFAIVISEGCQCKVSRV